jgi:hypothetical protein
MKPHEISSQYPIYDANQNHEAHLSESLAEPALPEQTEVPLSAWLVSGIFGVTVIMILLFCLKQIFNWRRKQGYTSNWDYHQHIPCHNCRFSSRNSYLKCAVHPTKAMKKAAIGCSDYWAKDSDRFSQ